MTPELLCKCTGQAKRKKDETAEQFLRRITHLYCAEKGIETIVRAFLDLLYYLCCGGGSFIILLML